MNHRLCLLLLGLMLNTTAGADGRVLEVIPLRHALVDDVVPILRDLVSAGGAVTGQRDQLIIRTTPQNLADLKTVLETLDRPLRQVRISVRQDVGRQFQWHEEQLSARVRAGDVEARVGGPPPGPGPGVNVQIGDGDGRLGYRNYATRGSEDDAHTHFVTTIEGRPAFITTGQMVPLANRQLITSPYGVAAIDAIDYTHVGSGFYVTPHLNGDRVNLAISPHADRLSRQGGGRIDSRGLETTASGRLGEWIALGGAGQSARNDGHGIAHRTRGADSERYDVWVKVDIIPSTR
ncbi:MAG: secretin N-terminal domain-containing protein [Gammaproteobacteria bacterium]